MEIGSAFSSGLQGLQQASGQLSEEAININRQTTQRQNQQLQNEQSSDQGTEQQASATQEQAKSLESSIVSLTTESRNAEANVRSIQTADEVLGSIIDVRV
ncbi:MAG: hypothetical protein ACI9FJ_000468 [Alteromonadaceae bacterium]|jgi:hypothetical protein